MVTFVLASKVTKITALTDRKEIFCREYLIGLNAMQSAFKRGW